MIFQDLAMNARLGLELPSAIDQMYKGSGSRGLDAVKLDYLKASVLLHDSMTPLSWYSHRLLCLSDS